MYQNTRKSILTPYPDMVKTIINDLQSLRQVGVALDTLRCRGIILARLQYSIPEIFESVAKDGSRFRCSETWVKEFLNEHLNWTFRRATRAAQKLPPNVDQVLLNQFLRLALTIRDCAIFDSAFLVNIEQTNIVYQPSNTSTFEVNGSKQVAVIGQEEKRAFTYVTDILVPYWEEQKALVGAPADQECVGQPCDVGIQRPFKLAVKHAQHADIVNESLTRLSEKTSPALVRLDTTIGTLRNRSLQWVINGYHAINKPELVKQAFFMCKAGKDFSLSFESLTSREALQYLQEVQKNDIAGWTRIATAQYNTGVEAADELELTGEVDVVSTEPPFDSINEQDIETSDVPMEVLIEHLALGSMHTVDGGLSSANHSEIYNISEGTDLDIEGAANAEWWRGKRRRIANKMYNDFWTH
ncbi:hypothetical protein BDR07DRAFT_1360856 [Suillus spraguei]|nr:hypothetical protein BDR07DRAFT_1360856 [Suillus spraguei]